jgi:starvation-inducible outer membrane lipoprotein
MPWIFLKRPDVSLKSTGRFLENFPMFLDVLDGVENQGIK